MNNKDAIKYTGGAIIICLLLYILIHNMNNKKKNETDEDIKKRIKRQENDFIRIVKRSDFDTHKRVSIVPEIVDIKSIVEAFTVNNTDDNKLNEFLKHKADEVSQLYKDQYFCPALVSLYSVTESLLEIYEKQHKKDIENFKNNNNSIQNNTNKCVLVAKYLTKQRIIKKSVCSEIEAFIHARNENIHDKEIINHNKCKRRIEDIIEGFQNIAKEIAGAPTELPFKINKKTHDIEFLDNNLEILNR